MFKHQRKLSLMVSLAGFHALAAPCLAQESDAAATGPGIKPAAPEAEPPDYVIPDLKRVDNFIPHLDTRVATARLSVEVIGDWTDFRQDDASVAQAGLQEDQFELRSLAIDIMGQIGPRRRISYKVGTQYKGFNANPGQKWNVTDVAFTFDIPRWNARLKIGRFEESFSYEVVGSTVSMPQSERTTNPFSAPSNPGISMTHVIGADQRMTLSYGLYKDKSDAGGGSLGLAARVTALVWGAPGNGTAFLHLGASALHAGADSTARYRAKPGSDVADYYVDTGEFPTHSANHFGLEAQYSNVHGWSLLSEYVVASVNSVNNGNLRFHGFYILGSWVLTGESRPYNRTTGVVERIVPSGRWGAPELVARYSTVELNDGVIQGGRYDRVDFSFNWWATTRWKLGVVAGRVWLDRYGQRQVTDTILTRLQWVY